MKPLFALLFVCLLCTPCSALVITDSFDFLNAGFWNLDTTGSRATLTTDPVTGEGSVLQIRGSSFYHEFEDQIQGLVSLDMYLKPFGGPHQFERLVVGSASIFIAGSPSGTTLFYPNGNVHLDPIEIPAWHTFSIAVQGSTASTYIDNILYDEFALEGPATRVSVHSYYSSRYYGPMYVDNFKYIQTPAVVPEPSTWVLIGFGLLFMSGYYVKKRTGGMI